MTGQDVVNRAMVLLNDSGNTNAQVAANFRWPTSELLLWITDAQREAVIVAPNVGNTTTSVPLVAGTRQTLTTQVDAWLLLSIRRNLTSTGAGGRAVRQTTAAILDAFNPNWHTDVASPVVQNYIFDVEDKKVFYVYPPNDGTGFVEANVAASPAPVTTLTQVLTLDDVYLGALASYVCYRALMKDAEYAGGMSLAQGYYSQFYQSMTAQSTAAKTDSPNTSFATPAVQEPDAVPPPQARK